MINSIATPSYKTKVTKMEWNEIEALMEEIIQRQRQELLSTGRRLIPTLTTEDILQPNDFNELEHNPHFRYEEGVLAGMQTLQMALRALKKHMVTEI